MYLTIWGLMFTFKSEQQLSKISISANIRQGHVPRIVTLKVRRLRFFSITFFRSKGWWLGIGHHLFLISLWWSFGMSSKEVHTHQADQWDNQILVGKIIDYCVCGKNAQEKLKKHQGYPSHGILLWLFKKKRFWRKKCVVLLSKNLFSNLFAWLHSHKHVWNRGQTPTGPCQNKPCQRLYGTIKPMANSISMNFLPWWGVNVNSNTIKRKRFKKPDISRGTRDIHFQTLAARSKQSGFAPYSFSTNSITALTPVR